MPRGRKYKLIETEEAPADGAAETSSALDSDCTNDCSIESAGSQGGTLKNEAKSDGTKDGRQRAYAFLAYEDSSLSDWEQRLADEHIAALVSPWHDKDENPDGTPKKKHKHIMLMFEGKKSVEQINEIRERVLGPNYNRGFENIGSLRGYARYLVHADNPEKAQYSRADVTAYGGADYDAITALPSDDSKALAEIMAYIREHKVRYYSDFMLTCAENNREWFNMLVSRKSYVVVEFIKSEAVKAKHDREQAEFELMGRERVHGTFDTRTGEFFPDMPEEG